MLLCSESPIHNHPITMAAAVAKKKLEETLAQYLNIDRLLLRGRSRSFVMMILFGLLGLDRLLLWGRRSFILMIHPLSLPWTSPLFYLLFLLLLLYVRFFLIPMISPVSLSMIFSFSFTLQFPRSMPSLFSPVIFRFEYLPQPIFFSVFWVLVEK